MGDVVSWLPEVTGVPLAELLTTDDPEIVAAAERLAEEIAAADPDGCC